VRLAFFLDQLFWCDGRVLSTDESYIIFPASFACQLDELVFVSRLSRETGRGPYELNHPRISFCPIPDYIGLRQLWRANPSILYKIRDKIYEEAPRWDAILVSGPHPIGQIIARHCLKVGVPVALLVRQNLVEWQKSSREGIKRLGAVTIAKALEWDFKRLARGRTVFTVGNEMAGEYRRYTNHVYNHFPCLVNDKQFQMLSTLQTSPDPTRLIYVGRLSREKGLNYLLQALRLLRTGGIFCILDIVGSGDLEDELSSIAAALGIESQVTFQGYIPYGPLLFDMYRRAAAMVLPSLTEGLPQVVAEALSIGVPTIATRVGGLPSFLTDNETALLVPPRDPVALAQAIELMLSDKNLRERLSANGRALMRNNTLDVNRSLVLGVLRKEVARSRLSSTDGRVPGGRNNGSL